MIESVKIIQQTLDDSDDIFVILGEDNWKKSTGFEEGKNYILYSFPKGCHSNFMLYREYYQAPVGDYLNGQDLTGKKDMIAEAKYKQGALHILLTRHIVHM